MIFRVLARYSPEVTKQKLVATIETQTERTAIDAFKKFCIKRTREDGRKFAKNFALKKDGKQSESHNVFLIGANTLGGVSLYFVTGGDINNGTTIAKIPFPVKKGRK